MAYDGTLTMTDKTEALEKAEEVRRHLRAIERAIAWGLARTEGNGLLFAALTVAKACAGSLHRALEAVAGLTGKHFQTEDFALYSGGHDDKPDPGGP